MYIKTLPITHGFENRIEIKLCFNFKVSRLSTLTKRNRLIFIIASIYISIMSGKILDASPSAAHMIEWSNQSARREFIISNSGEMLHENTRTNKLYEAFSHNLE